jgi:small-conductance mechanosensitive channel
MVDTVTVVTQNRWMDMITSSLPAILGAIIILLVGWIIGRLLGKAVRFIIDKAISHASVNQTELGGKLKNSGVSLGYLGDIATRVCVYLIAILAAVDFLNMDYMSLLMTAIVGYIPHIAAFVIILVVGFILIDYFLDLLVKYHDTKDVDLIRPVLLLLRIFLYFVIVILALSQLMIDLTIIYTFVTPIAWGIGIGLGAAIAITFWFGMKNRSEQLIDRFLETIGKNNQ